MYRKIWYDRESWKLFRFRWHLNKACVIGTVGVAIGREGAGGRQGAGSRDAGSVGVLAAEQNTTGGSTVRLVVLMRPVLLRGPSPPAPVPRKLVLIVHRAIYCLLLGAV